MLEWLAANWFWNLLWGFLAMLIAFVIFFLAGGLAFLSSARTTKQNFGFFSSFVSLGLGGCLMLLSTLVAGFFWLLFSVGLIVAIIQYAAKLFG